MQTKEAKRFNIIIEYLTYGFLVFLFAKLFININLFYLNGILGFWGSLIFMLNLISTKEIQKLEIIILATLLIGILINIIFIKNASLYEPIWIFCYFGIYLSLKNKFLNPKNLLAITCLFFGIIIILSFKKADPNLIFNSKSRNGISAFGIFFLSLYYISSIISNKKIFIFPTFLLLYCCIWSTGRTAFLVAILWIIGLIIFNPNKNKFEFNYKILIFLLAYLIIYFLAIPFIKELNLQNIDSSNFASSPMLQHYKKYGVSSPRFSFWSNYIMFIHTNPKAFILGASRINQPELYPFAENLHNVFFMLHSKTGMIGFIPIVYLLFRSSTNMVKRKKYTILFVFLIFTLRALFDWVGFFGLYDILFYYVIFTFNEDLFNGKTVYLNFFHKKVL